MGFQKFVLYVFLSFVGTLFFEPSAIAYNRDTENCPRGLLGYLQSWFAPSERQAHTQPLMGSRSLMIGVPPGVSLDSREILDYHVRDLFERPVDFSWVRILSWPMRRHYGHLGRLEPIYDLIGSEVHIDWEDVPDVRREGRTTLRATVSSEFGRSVVLLFDEAPLEDGMTYFICHDLFVLP